MKTPRGFIQGYTAQTVAAEGQILVAAEVITGGNERARLGPMTEAAETELESAGITERPALALADAGYWNSPQIEALEAKGMKVLVPPDADTRKAPSKIRRGGRYQRMRERLAEPEAKDLYRRRQQMIEPVFAQIKQNRRAGRFLAPRLSRLPRRMAPDRRHTQPPEALSQRFGPGWGLKGSTHLKAVPRNRLAPAVSRVCATRSMESRSPGPQEYLGFPTIGLTLPRCGSRPESRSELPLDTARRLQGLRAGP